MGKNKHKRSDMRVSDIKIMKNMKNPGVEQNTEPVVAEKSGLKTEDRILWESVARTTRPLRPVKPARAFIVDDLHLWDIENGLQHEKRVQAEPEKTPLTPVAKDRQPHNHKKTQISANLLHDIDRPTIRKIAKGRLEIQARIDLHGMRQREAHDLLYGFLADAWHRGLRFVLVITGKGTSLGSDGVLKQAVPQWFSTPLFRLYVSAYEDAVRHHGGQGALYVRLRKTPAEKLAEGSLLPPKRYQP